MSFLRAILELPSICLHSVTLLSRDRITACQGLLFAGLHRTLLFGGLDSDRVPNRFLDMLDAFELVLEAGMMFNEEPLSYL
jgi:hypothetical protein